MKTRKLKHRVHLIAAAVMIAMMAASAAFGQTAKNINWERMQRDLDIMEGVLSKLLMRSSPQWGPVGENVNGVYFEGYGVVFQVEYNGLRVLTWSRTELERSLQKLKEISPKVVNDEEFALTPEAAPPVEVVETNRGQLLERLKSQTSEFLANYADAIGQLDSGDRVTVVLDLGFGRVHFFTETGVRQRESDKNVAILEMTALKSDITDHRRGKLSLDEFRKRIEINEQDENETRSRNMDIMASILETALSRRHFEDYYLVGKNRAVYLKGLGALFFLNAELNLGRAPLPTVAPGEFGEDAVRVRVTQRETRSKKNYEESLQNFENTLVELIGDYGHTLHNLAPAERVAAAVKFNSFWPLSDDGARRFILMVKKQDLDNYNRGNIKLAEFKQRVQIQQY